MTIDRITSDESEGLFNDFIEDQFGDLIEQIVNEGDIDRSEANNSDLIVEMDDIQPPTLVYESESGSGQAGGAGSPNRRGDGTMDRTGSAEWSPILRRQPATRGLR